jgi:hypothetical protein
MDDEVEDLLDLCSPQERELLDKGTTLFSTIQDFIEWVDDHEEDRTIVRTEVLQAIEQTGQQALGGMRDVYKALDVYGPHGASKEMKRAIKAIEQKMEYLFISLRKGCKLKALMKSVEQAVGSKVVLQLGKEGTTFGELGFEFVAQPKGELVGYGGDTPEEALLRLRDAHRPAVDSMDETECAIEVAKLLPTGFTDPYARRTRCGEWHIMTRNLHKRHGEHLMEWFLSPTGSPDSITAWRSAVKLGRDGWDYLEEDCS